MVIINLLLLQCIKFNTQVVLANDVKIEDTKEKIQDEIQVDKFKYKFNDSDETAIIIEYCGDEENVNIASSVTIDRKEYRVTSTGKDTFYGCKNLKYVNLPDGLKSIGEGAFNYCVSLASVSIPEGVTEIGECAFAFCEKLTDVNIPKNIDTLNDGVFEGTKIEYITIPKNIKK